MIKEIVVQDEKDADKRDDLNEDPLDHNDADKTDNANHFTKKSESKYQQVSSPYMKFAHFSPKNRK